MSKTKHTKGPWKTSRADVRDAEGQPIADCYGTGTAANLWREVAEADAERIVACVNFCEGRPNEDLNELQAAMAGSGINGLESLMAATTLVTQERDTLCIALRNLVDNPNNPISRRRAIEALQKSDK